MVLTYDINGGRFLIRPQEKDDSIVTLMFQPAQEEQVTLALFRSVQDALQAVLNQETGLEAWDALEPEAIPAKIYDISQWNFEESGELG